MRWRFARGSAAIAVALGVVALVAPAPGCSFVRDLDGLGDGVPDGGGHDGDGPLLDGGIDAPTPPIDAANDAPNDAASDADAGTAYASEVLADHPVAYFRFGDATLALAKNERSSGDGHFAGSTATAGVPGLIAGDPDTAVRLEGSARVTLPTVPGLFIGQAPFSIEAWIALDDTDGGTLPTQWIVGREDVANPRFGVSFLVDSSGVALERWVNQNASRVTGPNPHKAAASHVVTTFDGTKIEVWVDDTPGGLAPSPQDVPANTYPTVAGSQSSQVAGFFHGVMDELALYDYVLPADRISAHWRAGKGP